METDKVKYLMDMINDMDIKDKLRLAICMSDSCYTNHSILIHLLIFLTSSSESKNYSLLENMSPKTILFTLQLYH